MRTDLNTLAAPPGGTRSRPGVRLGNAMKSFLRTYREHHARRLAAAHLRSWSDDQLKDIGLSRGEIEFAVRGLEPRRRPPRSMA